MNFNRRTITKLLDLVNLQRHNDNYADIQADLSNHEGRITGAQSDITKHKESTQAHSAEHVTYEGAVTGASNIKQAIDSQNSRINNLIINAGDSGPEARDARVSASSGVTYPTLKARLDGEMSNLINYLNYMPINGGSFDGDDPTGPVIDGGTY
jgi:hypothetical protein